MKQPQILGLIGSPRRGGNTEVLVQAALTAAGEAGAAAAAVSLGGLRLGECDGCHACWQGKQCPRRDDINELYPRLAAADAVLFGTPVYWYGPTGLMKLLLDRLVYFNCEEHRPQVRGTRAGLIVPCEEEDPAAAALVVELFRRSLEYLEMEFVGSLIAPGVTARGEARDKPALVAQAEALGRSLVRP